MATEEDILKTAKPEAKAPQIAEDGSGVRPNAENTQPTSVPTGNGQESARGHAEQTAPPSQQANAAAGDTPAPSNVSWIDKIYAEKHPDRLTPEEEEKERKREKRKKIFAAIADGVSAISNIWAASAGAPSSQQVSLSEANRKRYQAVLDKRTKQRDEYFAALERAYGKDTDYEQAMAKLKADQEFSASENAKDRILRSDEANKDRQFKNRQGRKERRSERRQIKDRMNFERTQSALDRDVRKEEHMIDKARVTQQNMNSLRQTHGQEQTLFIGDKLYPLGERTIRDNAAYFSTIILEELKNSPQFKGLSEKELANNSRWQEAKSDLEAKKLGTGELDVEKMVEGVKKYVQYSPTAMNAISQLSDNYIRDKKSIQAGARGAEDYGFVPSDSSSADIDALFD